MSILQGTRNNAQAIDTRTGTVQPAPVGTSIWQCNAVPKRTRRGAYFMPGCVVPCVLAALCSLRIKRERFKGRAIVHIVRQAKVDEAK